MRAAVALALLTTCLSACGDEDAATPVGPDPEAQQRQERAIRAATGNAAWGFHIDATGYPTVYLAERARPAEVGPELCAAINRMGPGPDPPRQVNLRAADGTTSIWRCARR